jgi:predicted nuclease of restriction endonuclease-like RecB superfamily
MLTKDLLEVTKHKPNIKPRYREIDEYRPTAERVIEAYQPGRRRGEIEEQIADLETHDTFKLVRGLSKLLDRRVTFEQQSPIAPEQLRDAVFTRGFVTDSDERQEVLEQTATEYGLTPAEVENGLWADRDEHAVLVSSPDIGPKELLREYNLSLTQTLLFDGVELEFDVSDNYQEIFQTIAYLGLMYHVQEDITVTVTGPASVLKQTRKYGTELAKLLPAIMTATEWEFTAQIETEVSDETRIYEFTLDDSQADVFPTQTTTASFDSEIERDFATRIGSLVEGWSIKREPTILRTGDRVMIPDFSFEREYGSHAETAEFYLEVIGFWTPEYMAEKLEKVRHVESDVPMMLAVNETLNCTEEDFAEANVDQVFFYEDTIPVKPVLSRLQAIEERLVETDLQQLSEVDLSTDTVTDIDEVAEREQVEPGAIRRYITESDRYDGVLSNNQYVPQSVLAAIREEIDAVDEPTLAEVSPILEEYQVAQNIIEEIGYEIEYTSFDQTEAAVRKQS